MVSNILRKKNLNNNAIWMIPLSLWKMLSVSVGVVIFVGSTSWKHTSDAFVLPSSKPTIRRQQQHGKIIFGNIPHRTMYKKIPNSESEKKQINVNYESSLAMIGSRRKSEESYYCNFEECYLESSCDDNDGDNNARWENDDDDFIVYSRRSMMIMAGFLGSSTVMTSLSCDSAAVAMPPPTAAMPPPMLGGNRVEGMGGGFDLLTFNKNLLKESDAFFPQSCSSPTAYWNVKRVVTSMEGDAGQAAIIWKALGGPEENSKALLAGQRSEVYTTRFVPSPNLNGDATYTFDEKTLISSVLDRGFEIANRNNKDVLKDVSWNAEQGGDLSYTIINTFDETKMELKVMQRKNNVAENGWGSDEIIRIRNTGGRLGDLYRVARVKRKFRRGFDETTGERIIDGIEIVTTYRVLDGIAGIEMPTSTTRSIIRMTANQP